MAMCLYTHNHTHTWQINRENYQKPNYWGFSPDQSKLVWLSVLGTALVCGLSLTAEWAQKGDSLVLPIGPLPPLHFLLDLTTRHLPDSNSHSASCSPPQQQNHILTMNHTANCSITSTITHLKKEQKIKKRKEKNKYTEVRTNLTC